MIYEAGRLYNELIWWIDQAVMLGRRGLVARVERLFGELAFKLVPALPLDSALNFKDRLLAIQEDWLGLVGSEWFADELSEACDAVTRDRDSSPNDAFSSLLLQAKILRDAARSAIEDHLIGREDLKAAFLLGQYIDQGLRPPDVALHVYIAVPNMHRLIRLISPRYRREIEEYERKFNDLAGTQSGPLRLTREIVRNQPERPRLPETTVIVGCPRRPGTVGPPRWWRAALHAFCQQMQLAPAMFSRIFEDHLHPTDLVDRLDREVRDILAVAHDARPLESPDPRVEQASKRKDGDPDSALVEPEQDQQSRKPTKQEREVMIQNCIDKYQNVKIRQVKAATGLALSTICTSDAWRAEMDRRKKRRPSSSARATKSISGYENMLEDKRSDFSYDFEKNDRLETEFMKESKKEDQHKYLAMTTEERSNFLVLWEEQRLDASSYKITERSSRS